MDYDSVKPALSIGYMRRLYGIVLKTHEVLF